MQSHRNVFFKDPSLVLVPTRNFVHVAESAARRGEGPREREPQGQTDEGGWEGGRAPLFVEAAPRS